MIHFLFQIADSNDTTVKMDDLDLYGDLDDEIDLQNNDQNDPVVEDIKIDKNDPLMPDVELDNDLFNEVFTPSAKKEAKPVKVKQVDDGSGEGEHISEQMEDIKKRNCELEV